MKLTTIIYCLVGIFLSACATLNISEIKNLETRKFDTLALNPDWETNDLRIDIIRQTFREEVNDSTKRTKDRPYHPLGFNLGNGLFYDLNKNLSLRLDYILDFSPDQNFEIHSTIRPEKSSRVTSYKFINDSLFVQYQPRPNNKYRFHRISYGDSIAVMYKRRLSYAVVETDSSLKYNGKKRTWDIINKVDDNNYYLNKKKWKDNYKIKDNDIFLENDFVISLTNNGSRIEIKNQRKKRKDRVLFTIEKDYKKLFIYNENYAGLLIEKKGNSILIYRNNTLLQKYELKSGSNKV